MIENEHPICYDYKRILSWIKNGGSIMAFVSSVIVTLVKAIFVGAVAFCGILLGKNLRKRKDAKKETESVDAQ